MMIFKIKKLVLVACLCFLPTAAVQASVTFQLQANILGRGLGLGWSAVKIPLRTAILHGPQTHNKKTWNENVNYNKASLHDFLLELGIEANSAVLPWEHTEEREQYDGSLSWRGSRLGGYAKFNFKKISPVLRFGTQLGELNLRGNYKLLGSNSSSSDFKAPIQGAYFSLGFPVYVGPVFVELSLGTQSIYIPKHVNIKSITDIQISTGIVFL